MGREKALVIGVGRVGSTADPNEETPVGSTPWDQLGFVYDVVPRLERALDALAYDVDVEIDPDADRVLALSARVARVVHLVAHGADDELGDRNRLDLVPSDGALGPGTNVAEWLSTAQVRRRTTLFLVDLCGSGRVARLPFVQHGPENPVYAWVIAASGAEQDAYDGRFTTAVADVLEELARTGLGTDPTLRNVAFSLVARRVSERVRTAAGVPQSVHATGMDLSVDEPALPFFPNPRFRADAPALAAQGIDPPVRDFLADHIPATVPAAFDPDHFVHRAGRHFSGRFGPVRRLAGWWSATTDPGPRLVTGSPGVGKSAVLSVLACSAHPRLAEVVPGVRAMLVGRDPSGCPPLSPDLAAVHARARGVDEVLDALAAQWGMTPPVGGWTPTDLVRAASAKATPVRALVDAVDEAADPRALAERVLVPLARATRVDGVPAVRLLVAARRRPELGALFGAVGDGLLDLDLVDAAELRGDLVAFLDASLSDVDGYRGDEGAPLRRAVVGAAADRLALGDAVSPDWGGFLVATVFATYLATVPPPRDQAAGARLGASVPATLPEVLQLDLSARDRGADLAALLSVAAHGFGQGMPADLLAAAAPAAGGGLLDEQTAQRLLDDGRFYLRTGTETDGTTTYRLFHQGLVDHLRGELPAAALADRLLGGRDWRTAPPYLVRHGIEHAAEAARADGLVTDPEFLVHADPATLLPALDRVRDTGARDVASVYRTSVGAHRDRGPGLRRQVLCVDAARHGLPDLQTALAAGLPEWRPLWATGAGVAPELRHAVENGPGVRAVAGAEVDGRPVAVLGDLAGVVTLLDVRSGVVRNRLRSFASEVNDLDTAVVDGVPVAVSADGDGAVRIWDLATGRLRAELRWPSGGWPTALRCIEVGGDPLALVGGSDGVLRSWRLDTGQLRREIVTGHRGAVDKLAVARTRRQGIALTVSRADGAVRVWDVDSLGWLGDLQADEQATAVGSVGVLRGFLALVTYVSGACRLWDPLRRRLLRDIPLDVTLPYDTAVSCATVGRIPVAAIAGVDRVEVRNLLTGGVHAGPLSPAGPARGLAHLDEDGAPRLVTGGLDGWVRVWDTRRDRGGSRSRDGEISVAVAAHAGIRFVGVRPVVATAGHDGIRIRDADTGRELRDPVPQSGGMVSVAAAVVGGRTVLAAAGSDSGGRIRTWDVESGRSGPELDGPVGYMTELASAVIDGESLVLAATEGGELRAWNLRSGELRTSIPGAYGGIRARPACTIVEDRPVVLLGMGDTEVGMWDLRSGTRSDVRIETDVPGISSITCFRHGGRPLAAVAGFGGATSGTSGVDARVPIFDLRTGARHGELVGHTGWALSVTVGTVAGRQVLATGGLDGTVRTWELDGTPCHVWRMPDDVTSVEIDDDGRLIVVTGPDLVVLRCEDAR